MRSFVSKLVLLGPFVALLGGAAPAQRPGELPAETLLFADVDGSAWDADGAVDGVWTWAQPLELEQRLTCGADAECSLALAVAGDLEIAPGAGIEASGGLRLAVDGEVRLAAGSFLATGRGPLSISATRGIAIDGLLSTSADPGFAPAGAGSISIESTGGPGHGVRVGDAATLISEGGLGGGNTIRLAGCGIEVRGLVAAIAQGPGAAVVMSSCEELAIDGRDLDPLLGRPGGQRRGRVEVRGQGGSPRIDLRAAGRVLLDGTELRVGGGEESRIEVTAELGGLSWRHGRGRVERASGRAATRGAGAAADGDGPASGIRLSACDGFDLTGADLRPAAEVELIDACGADEKEDRALSPGLLFGTESPSETAGTRSLPCTPDLILTSQTVTTIEEYEACTSITATDFRVIPRGFVTFRAGQLIVLGEGFSVEGSSRGRWSRRR